MPARAQVGSVQLGLGSGFGHESTLVCTHA